jgi:hypothetical protein
MDRSASVSKQIGLGGDLRHIKNKLRNLGEVMILDILDICILTCHK